jgi:hypothetical protein
VGIQRELTGGIVQNGELIGELAVVEQGKVAEQDHLLFEQVHSEVHGRNGHEQACRFAVRFIADAASQVRALPFSALLETQSVWLIRPSRF